MTQICLIDAKNFLYRNHYTHRDLKGPNGEPTSVLYGCLNGLLALHRRLPDVGLILVWDGGGETWRHRFLSGHKKADPIKVKSASDWVGKQIAGSINFLTQANHASRVAIAKAKTEKPVGYKAQRISAAHDEDKANALVQISELKRITKSLGIKNFKIHGLEGDDLIGILATAIINRKLYDQVIIHSSDTDFYQLLSPEIRILKRIGIDGQLEWMDHGNVLAEYHVNVKDWIKYRAITGDVSDNIPKLLHKVGPVRAIQLLRAGVDASKGRHEISLQAINALNDMTKGTIDIDDFWKRLRKNYIACQILTNNNFVAPEMDEEVGTKIVALLSLLGKDALVRDEEGKSEQAYRGFCEWCMEHGMADLRSHATEFASFV